MTPAASIKTRRIFEGRFLPPMHIRRGADDIAQAGHAERTTLTGVAGDGLGAQVNELARRIGNTEHRQLLVGEQRRGVALGAPGNKGAKYIQPLNFIRIQRRVVAMRI
ncbi:MAG: Uncharacterised protein [Halieaceae bacterium]|nr:MAG: Uncharacterised protein [Halieaceae bacterium]